MSKKIRKTGYLFLNAFFLASLTLMPLALQAEDDPPPKADSVWGAMKYSGHYIKKGGVAAGHGIKKGGVKAGEGIKKGGKATGRGFKKAGKSIKKFFVGDS